MKFTIDWLKEHLDTNYDDNKIVNKLTDIGLEVESFQSQLSELDNFEVSISHTTRQPRLNEKSNKDYYFVWVDACFLIVGVALLLS